MYLELLRITEALYAIGYDIYNVRCQYFRLQTSSNLFALCHFSIHNFFTEGKKAKGWLGMEGVGGVALGRWAERYSLKQFDVSIGVRPSCRVAKLVIRYTFIQFS